MTIVLNLAPTSGFTQHLRHLRRACSDLIPHGPGRRGDAAGPAGPGIGKSRPECAISRKRTHVVPFLPAPGTRSLVPAEIGLDDPCHASGAGPGTGRAVTNRAAGRLGGADPRASHMALKLDAGILHLQARRAAPARTTRRQLPQHAASCPTDLDPGLLQPKRTSADTPGRGIFARVDYQPIGGLSA